MYLFDLDLSNYFDIVLRAPSSINVFMSVFGNFAFEVLKVGQDMSVRILGLILTILSYKMSSDFII